MGILTGTPETFNPYVARSVMAPVNSRRKRLFPGSRPRSRRYKTRIAHAWMAGKNQSRRVARENLRRKNRKRTIEIAKNRQVDKTRNKPGINASLAGINSKTWATME